MVPHREIVGKGKATRRKKRPKRAGAVSTELGNVGNDD
jgi:hypothetical protein